METHNAIYQIVIMTVVVQCLHLSGWWMLVKALTNTPTTGKTWAYCMIGSLSICLGIGELFMLYEWSRTYKFGT